MIGQPKWFKRRQYGGWGFTPETWQGWVYLAVVVGIFVLLQKVSFLSDPLRIILMIIWGVLFTIDTLHIMAKLHKDERESVHEAFAERNAVWAMVMVLCIGMSYQVAQGIVLGKTIVDPFLIATLLVGAVVKSLSNWYLRDK